MNKKKQKRGIRLVIESDRGAIFIAKYGDKIVGMCSVQLVISSAMGGFSSLIEDMIVISDYRGKGVGRILLNQAIEWAKRNGALRHQLLADKTNRDALEFYDKLGWEKTRMICLRKFDN